MSNYCGAARSNYFRVKDPEAFKAEMTNYNVEVWDRVEENGETLYALGSNDDGGDWPSYNSETDEDIDFMEVLAPLVADGEVVVFQCSGAEKLRYIGGHAIAFNNQREYVCVNLDDIYQLAKNKFNVEPTVAQY